MGLYGVYDLIENAVTIIGHATAVGVNQHIMWIFTSLIIMFRLRYMMI